MSTRLTIRLDFELGRRLGAGKVALLESIDKTGSISAASPFTLPLAGQCPARPVICGRPLGKRVFDGLIALVGCGHMSGLWCGIGPLALMIFDSPGPYHCGELGSS